MINEKKKPEDDEKDFKTRIVKIQKILKPYFETIHIEELINSYDFITELHRTANIIIDSNILPISSGVKIVIKDLNENNEKRIILENNQTYLKSDNIIFGNDKYKDVNYKSLTDAVAKDVKILKTVINYKKKDFTTDVIKQFIEKIKIPKTIVSDDEYGILYDNNNTTTPKYEIYVYVDLIDGKITDDNQNDLNLCSFRDELLLIKFNQLRNNETYVLQHDPLIKILSPIPPKVKGGSPTRRLRRKRNNHKTKKIVK